MPSSPYNDHFNYKIGHLVRAKPQLQTSAIVPSSLYCKEMYQKAHKLLEKLET